MTYIVILLSQGTPLIIMQQERERERAHTRARKGSPWPRHNANDYLPPRHSTHSGFRVAPIAPFFLFCWFLRTFICMHFWYVCMQTATVSLLEKPQGCHNYEPRTQEGLVYCE